MSYTGPLFKPTFPASNYQQDKCALLLSQLEQTTERIMLHIFSGNIQDPDQWFLLFRALTHAFVMKDFLLQNQTDLLEIADSFLVQFDQWQAEIGNTFP